MKSRTMRPLESPDTPYIARNMRNAREEPRELTLPPYKTSLTPPPMPTELAPDSAAERNLARAQTALEDVARREQILALAEERALFEAERRNRAKEVKLAEEALIRRRERLALEGKTPEGKSRGLETNVDHRNGNAAADQEPPQIGTEGTRSPQDSQGAVESKRVANPAPEVGQLLSRLAKQAADFAALAETVTELQRQLTEERTRHETTAKGQMDELRGRETALAQRESEADKRIQEERHALESKVAALEARETALEEKQLAFDECRRKFRETFSTFMKD